MDAVCLTRGEGFLFRDSKDLGENSLWQQHCRGRVISPPPGEGDCTLIMCPLICTANFLLQSWLSGEHYPTSALCSLYCMLAWIRDQNQFQSPHKFFGATCYEHCPFFWARTTFLSSVVVGGSGNIITYLLYFSARHQQVLPDPVPTLKQGSRDLSLGY